MMTDNKLQSIDSTELSARSKNALHRNGVHTVGEMMECTEEMLYNIPQIGRKSVDEILEMIGHYRKLQKTAVEYSENEAQAEEIIERNVNIGLQSIDSTELSVRSKNALQRNGVHTVREMMSYNKEMLYNIPQLGKKSVDEISEMIERYRNIIPIAAMQLEDDAKATEAYLRFYAIKTENLPLTASAYNILTFAEYEFLYQFIFMSFDELLQIDGMNERFAREIEKECERYLREKSGDIAAFAAHMQNDDGLLFFETLSDEKDRKAILDYVRVNDISVSQMALPTRAKNRLIASGHLLMSDMIFMTKDDIEQLGGLGEGSVFETFETIRCYRKEHEERIRRYLAGESSVLIDDDGVISLIRKEYLSLGFGGLSVSELSERLAKTVPIAEERIKKALGKLVASGELEYVDYRCYKTYDKFSEYYLTANIDDRKKNVIAGSLAGKTQEEIGDSYGITKERIRQLLNTAVKNVKEQHMLQTGTELFDEDYYAYFYQTYHFDRADGARWFGISDEIRKYLDTIGVKKGSAPLESALKDTKNLEAGLRMKIKNYINRNKIYIDGKWVEKTRAALESVVIRKYCKCDMNFAEFANIFHTFLKKNEIPYDESIYYTEAIIGTRKNRFMESRDVLWKFGETFRYYDIDGQDYTELFETLNLGSYRDIELSAEKFVMEYPELMEKYDIRDGYELHNLLKKVLETGRYGKYDELKIAKMPMLRFGESDRDGDMRNIMIENAPIKAAALYELIHKEYGYDIKQVPFYLSHLSEYYYRGMYSVVHKEMSEERMARFGAVLTEDFYTFDELKKIYCEIFAGADKDEVNSFNLKRMGFIVNSKYAVQHYSSAVKYIEAMLTREDMFDISSLRNRFAEYGFYYQAYKDLRKRLEIIEYEPDRFINFRKLERGGLTKEMVREFCDAVYDAAPDGQFFTVRSLCKNGFESELFDFGFEDLFYGSLLISDERYSFKKMFGTIFLRKDKKEISTKNLLSEIVKRERKIDFYDLETLLCEDYGCKSVDRTDCIYRTKDSELFYDSELQIFYANEELYYREIDEAGGFY